MPPDEPPPPPPQSPPPPSWPRFQFSLRSQLIGVTIVGVLLGLYVVVPRFVMMLLASLVYWVLPAPLLAGVVYGRDDIRAFSIGGLIPWATVWAVGGQPFLFAALRAQPNYEPWMPMLAAAMTVVASGASGFLVAATRRWIRRHGDQQSK